MTTVPATADGNTTTEGGFPSRWLLALFCLLALMASIWAVAGNLTGAVISTWIYWCFVLAVFVPAWMLGLLLTEPFERRDAFSASPWPRGYRSLVSVALGLGVFSLSVLAMGTLHLIEPAGYVFPLSVLPVGGIIVGFAATRRFLGMVNRSFFLSRAHKGDWLYLAATVPVAVLLIAAAFPPGNIWLTEARGYDVMEYHLQLPREYALNNSTAPLAHNVYSFLPANMEMLYLLMMQLAKGVMGSTRDSGYLWGTYPAQLAHVLMMLLTAAAIALMPLGSREKPWLGATGRAMAVLVFLGIPWTIVTGSLAYNEGGMLFFGTLALGIAFTHQKGSGILAGILLGLAIGCKMTAGVFFALPVAFIFALRGTTNHVQWQRLMVAAILAAVLYAPWAIRAAIYSRGNPVFPIAASKLGGKDWTPEQVSRFAKGHAAPSDITIADRFDALVKNSLLDAQWSVPLLAILHKEELVATRPATTAATEPNEPWWRQVGILWWGIPIALLCAMVARTGRGVAGILLGVLGIQIAAWLFATHLQGRFLLPIAIPLALLAGRGAQGLQLAGEGLVVAAMRILAGSVVVLHGLFTCFLLLPEVRMFHGIRPRAGETATVAATIGDAGSSLINIAAVSEHPEGGVEVDAKPVLLVGESRAWRIIGDVHYATAFDRNVFEEQLSDPVALMTYLRRSNISYVLINWVELERIRKTYQFESALSIEEMRTRVKQLEPLGLEPIQGDRRFEIYRVRK